MPDVLSHVLSAQLFRETVVKRATAAGLFVGVVFPDLLHTPPMNALGQLDRAGLIPDPVFSLVGPSHSAFFLALWAALIALMIEASRRRVMFLSVYSGMLLHLFLDLFQRKPDTGYLTFYPFSPKPVCFHVVWGDYWIWWLVGLVCALTLLSLWRRVRGQSWRSAWWPRE